jgi:uncharacterized OB-fold protein
MVDVNVVEGLVRKTCIGLEFLGAQCRVCGETIFPAIKDCPLCAKPGTMSPVGIPGIGAVRRAIVAERGPTGFEVPYVQAYVALDSGPVIYSTLDISVNDVDSIVGARVVAVMAPLSKIGDRVNYGWKFRRPEDAA